VTFDKLLDGDIGRAGRAQLGERTLQLCIRVDTAGSGCASRGARLEDDRVAHRRDKLAHLRGAGCADRLSCADPDRA
jgi:hypothetical protein